MPEENQFRLTVVTQKRVPRRDAEAQPPSEIEHSAPASGEPGSRKEWAQSHPGSGGQRGMEKSSPGREAHDHRHYRDFGTVNLGTMDGASRAASAPDSEPKKEDAPGRGQLQREFYDKYDTVLRRRYTTRSRAKATRFLMIALLFALALLISILWVSNLREQTVETIPRPAVETIPVGDLDLG